MPASIVKISPVIFGASDNKKTMVRAISTGLLTAISGVAFSKCALTAS